MASAWKQKRVTGAGEARWHVKWEGPAVVRANGSVRTRIHLGSFKTEREADNRIRWARLEWSEGRVPDPKRIVSATQQARFIRDVAPDWLASRVDFAKGSHAAYANRVERVIDGVGSIRVDEFTPRDARDWITRLQRERYAPSMISVLVSVLRLILDHADVDPNPARHRSVKLPRGRSTNARIRLPTRTEIARIRGELADDDRRRLLDFLEDAGPRINEALALDWRDVHDDRIVIRGTKRAASLRTIHSATSPIRLLDEERGRGRVFTVTQDAFSHEMRRILVFSPHDFRHLHASRLLHGGVSPAVIADRLGMRVPTLLSTYSHVVPPD